MRPFTIGILGNVKLTYEPHYEMNYVFRELQKEIPFQFEWVPTENLIEDAGGKLAGYQGIIAGSGPYNSKEGVINGIRFARENNIPFLGTCSGFGYSVLEFGQALFQLKTVRHLNEGVPLEPQETFLQPLSVCSLENHTICFSIVPDTITSAAYARIAETCEITHCNYGVHTEMIAPFAKEGLIVSAQDEQGEPKIMEYNRNDYFVIVLFLPQLQSTAAKPHPLIAGFLSAAGNRH